MPKRDANDQWREGEMSAARGQTVAEGRSRLAGVGGGGWGVCCGGCAGWWWRLQWCWPDERVEMELRDSVRQPPSPDEVRSVEVNEALVSR